MTRFVLRCIPNPTILHQVRVFSLHLLESRHLSDVDFELKALIPHLIGLKHFIGSGSLPVSTEVFTLLAQTAGQTLVTIQHLSINNDPVLHTSFTHFRKLNRIDFVKSPQIIMTDTSKAPSHLLPWVIFSTFIYVLVATECHHGKKFVRACFSKVSTRQVYERQFEDMRCPAIEPRNSLVSFKI